MTTYGDGGLMYRPRLVSKLRAVCISRLVCKSRAVYISRQTRTLLEGFNQPKSESLWKRLSEFAALSFVFSIWFWSQSALAMEEHGSTVEISTSSQAMNQGSFSHVWISGRERASSGKNPALSEFDNTEFPDREQESKPIELVQLETDVDIVVSGPISRVKVRQRFYNPNLQWLEGEYVYPLPENAVVDRLNMHVGERIVEGKIAEKKQAEVLFKEARETGKRASLVSQQRASQFRTRVTNIAPQELISVEFEYQHWLDFKDGQYSLRFPMVATPAYTPSNASMNRPSIETAQHSEHFRASHQQPGNPVSITARIDAGVPMQQPVSESHAVTMSKLNDTSYQIKLDGDAKLSNRDFLLNWSPQNTQLPSVSILREEHNGAHYGLMTVMPPQNEFIAAHEIPRELVLVLDVSGSMQGESIEQAKAALLEALSQLNPGDVFNLVWFSDRAGHLFPASQQASARNLSLARHRVKHLSANGGTNMKPALELALGHSSKTDERLRQVIFITDGAVTNEAELFSTIEQYLGTSRLFTVGIGSAPNSYFMRKAARAGRGTFIYVNRPEQVGHKITMLMQKLQQPALTHLALDFQGYSVDLLPEPLPDLYLGEPLYAVFMAEHFPEFVQVTGRLEGEFAHMNIPIDQPLSELGQRETGIAKEWARRKVDLLQEQARLLVGQDKASNNKKATQLALEYEIVSPFTSLIAVDREPVRNTEELLKAKDLFKTKVPSNLPKGFVANNAQGQVLALAQTSTGLWWKLYSGLLLLVMALFVWRAVLARPLYSFPSSTI